MVTTSGQKQVPSPSGVGDGVEGQLGQLLRAVFGQYKDRVTARLSDLGLSGLQSRALQQLGAGESMSTKQLAAALGAEPSNLTSVVDRLEAAGLVERAVPSHDRRVKLLRLTAEGTVMQGRVGAHLRETLGFFDRLTPAERGQLVQLLNRLAEPARGTAAGGHPIG